MTRKNENIIKLISLIIGLVAFWFALSDRLDKKIADNPKMVAMEVKLEEANKRLETAQRTLDDIFAELMKQKLHKGSK
jgi:uncharacterized membrane-anchored protein YhcB (DUF1043 family)